MRDKCNPMIIAAVYSFVFPTVVGCVAAWMALSEKNIGTVKDWQTLIAGVIAILAALMGGGFVYYQTSESRRQHDALLLRRHAAARSVLPLALSGLVDYAETAVLALEALRPTIRCHRVWGFPTRPFIVPSFASADVERLRDAIESASEEVGDRIARVISDVQVLDARLRDFPRRLAPKSTSLIVSVNLDDYIVNAVTIYGRCSELFSYARREIDEAPSPFPSPETMINSLNILGFDSSTHGDIYVIARVRAERHAAQEADVPR